MKKKETMDKKNFNDLSDKELNEHKLMCPSEYQEWIRTHHYVNDAEEKQHAINQTGSQCQDYEAWEHDKKECRKCRGK